MPAKPGHNDPGASDLMARPVRPWFRFYVEAINDRKLRRLKPSQRWLWAAVLAAARESPVPGVLLDGMHEPFTAADLADYAGMSLREVTATLAILERPEANMLGRDETTGAWRVLNWARRQPESDNTTERTRKHRSKEQDRNVPTSSQGTGRARSGERSASRALVRESELEIEPVIVSGSLTTPPAAPDDDQDPREPFPPPWPSTADQVRHDPVVETALAILAQRDLDARQQNPQLEPIGDVNAWLAKAIGQRRLQYASALAEHRGAHPDWPPEQLADAVDSPPAAGGRDPVAGEREALLDRAQHGVATVRSLLAEPAPPPELNAARAAAARQALHGQGEP